MEIIKLSFDEKSGWSDDLPVGLDSADTLILIFGATNYRDQSDTLLDLIEKFPESKFTGCSTGGEIFGSAVKDNSLSVAIVRFENTILKQVTYEVTDPSESFLSGKAIAKGLKGSELRGVFVIADSNGINASELVAGINSNMSPSVIVTGGFAGTRYETQNTWVIGGNAPQSNFVSAIGFYGQNVRIGYGSRDGLDILGIEQRITKADGNRLFEIDGKPALSLYKNYLGDKAHQLPESASHFPLSLRANLKSEKRLIRAVLEIDEETQSMTFGGDVPEGAMTRLMIANPERVIDGATEAAMMAEQFGLISDSVLSIAVSCAGRRAYLGERCEEELEAVMEEMPAGTQQVGFYSFGEICPYTVGSCDLHNLTMTLTTISEETLI